MTERKYFDEDFKVIVTYDTGETHITDGLPHTLANSLYQQLRYAQSNDPTIVSVVLQLSNPNGTTTLH